MTLDANLGYVNPPSLMDSEQEQYILSKKENDTK